jgi:DNA replication and repair protein RecF
MALDRITLATFRNHAATRLDGTARFNLLVGENGAGKTNVLEALSLLAPGRGLRRAALVDMAGQAGGGAFTVSAALDVRLGKLAHWGDSQLGIQVRKAQHVHE